MSWVVVLGILVTLSVRFPERILNAASTDMILMEDISTVWCGEQEIFSKRPFSTFKTSGEPSVQAQHRHVYDLHFHMKLDWGQQRPLRYRLLRGSVVRITTCSSDPRAYVFVVQGKNNFQRCSYWHDRLLDIEESEGNLEHVEAGRTMEEFEARQLQRLSTLKKNLREPGCKRAEVYRDIPISTSNQTVPHCKPEDTKEIVIRVPDSETYYVVVENFYYYGQNLISLNLTLERSTYDMDQLQNVCSGATKCVVPLAFASRERVVLCLPPEPDAGKVPIRLVWSCKPRVFFHAVIFLLIPLVFFMFLGCVVKMRSWSPRAKDSAVDSYTVVFTPLMSRPVHGGESIAYQPHHYCCAHQQYQSSSEGEIRLLVPCRENHHHCHNHIPCVCAHEIGAVTRGGDIQVHSVNGSAISAGPSCDGNRISKNTQNVEPHRLGPPPYEIANKTEP